MTDHEKLRELAQALAAANPDAAEALGLLLGPAARSAKVGGLGFGIAVRARLTDGQMEIRGGDLRRYIEGRPAGDGYEAVIVPPKRGSRRE